MIMQIAQRLFQNQATRVITGTLIRPDFSFSAEKSLCILYNSYFFILSLKNWSLSKRVVLKQIHRPF